jgi:hypothetical protein
MAPALTRDDTSAAAERTRCILLLQQKARSFEERKLFTLSRALIAIAEEIGGSTACP